MIRPNPFVVPGLEDEPDQPLCPWQEDFGRHDRYYSTVGGHDDAFELFKQKLQPGQLDRASRIVVITGPPLSGKTSLANRCVYWVREGLNKEATRCYIYPLRGVSPSRATVEERVKKVCRRLIEKLRELNPGSGEGLAGNLLSADEVLPLFGRFHQPPGRKPTQYFIILLPSLEPETAEIEIDEYRAALDGVRGVLCVTENPADVPLPAYRGEALPISLRLRHLHTGECRTVVAGWPGAPKEGDSLPIIRENDLDELEDLLRTMNGKITLGKLLTALRKVYNNQIDLGDHPSSDVRYVEYSELIKSYLGSWARLPPQGSA